MRRTLLAISLLLVIVSCGGDGGGNASSPPPPPPPPAGPSASEQLASDLQGLTLDEFYFESFGALIRRSPETVTWEALESVYPLDGVGLDDLSDGFQRETFAMYRVVLDALRCYDRGALTVEQQLDYDTY